MAHSTPRDPAAMLRGHYENPARGEEERQLARVGRARLSQRMAVAPVNHGFAFNPALRLASGVAALALIAITAVHIYQPTQHSVQHAAQTISVKSALVIPAPVITEPAPVITEPAPVVTEPAPSTVLVPARPQSLPIRHTNTIAHSPTTFSTQAPSPKPQAPELALDLDQTSAPIPSLWGHEPSSELRLAKVSDGILISWDGRHPSNHQFELTKTCVDLRHPGAATTSTRIRLNTSEWVDDSKTGACGPGEAAQYEVAEVGQGHA